MIKRIVLFSCSLLIIGNVFAQNSSKTPAQQLVANTGEDSLNSFSATHSHTVISGYGEVAYQRDFNNQTATVNLNRAVLFVGHQFTGRIAFFSELEVENAKVEAGGPIGEVGMEQCYLKFAFNPRQYLVAGLFVPRIGIINETHLPVNYNGMERPIVEQIVIPSTWREVGVGFYGQTTGLPLTYSVALLNGLDNSGFQHGTGIREGRTEGQLGSANQLALTAAVQYFAGNWKFQLCAYMGGTTGLKPKVADSLGLTGGAFGTPVYLAEADIQYQEKGISFKALGTTVAIPDAEKINNAYASGTPNSMYGTYAELGYNLLEHAKKAKWSSKQLVAFARYEILDLNATVPSNIVTDGTLQQTHLIAGFSYLPMPNVVIKADVRLMHTGAQTLIPSAVYNQNNTFLNIGVGYSF